MRAGFSEIDITPKELGRLGRLIAAPTQVQAVHSPLYARLAVFDDGACRAAILSLDKNFIFSQNVPEVRDAIAAAGDVEPMNVMVTCTHTHNSFPTTPWHEEDGFRYEGLDYLLSFMPQLTEVAVSSLAECTIRSAAIEVPGLTQNRRCCYRGDDGQVHVATHGPHNVDNFVGVEGPVDDELKVMMCRSLDGEVLGGIVNVAAHPTTMFGEPVYSSSYIGPIAERLREEYGAPFGFLYGLSGDLCLDGRSTGHDANERIGRLLGEKAVEALSAESEEMKEAEVRVLKEAIPLPLRRVTEQQIRAAKEFQRLDPAEVDERELCRRLYGHDFIFYGQSARNVTIFINEIIGTWEFQRRSGRRNLTFDFEVQGIRIGDVAVIGFASELFNEVKHRLQSESPFKTTLFAAMANGGHGYIPPPASHEHGGYETCVGVASMFETDASPTVEAVALKMLKQLA